MGWLYVGSVLTRVRLNVSPGWSALITMDDTLVPENKRVHSHKSLQLHLVRDLLYCLCHLLPQCKRYWVIFDIW